MKIKLALYSKRNVLVGKKYIDITTTQNNTTQDFSMYFELKDVTSYEVSIVDHKEEQALLNQKGRQLEIEPSSEDVLVERVIEE